MDPVPVSTRKDRVHKVTQQSDMEASRETEKNKEISNTRLVLFGVIK